MREKFTISNLDPRAYKLIWGFCAFGFIFIGIIVMLAGVIDKPGKPWEVLLGLLILAIGFVIPLGLARLAKTEVQFDGMYISHRCPIRNIKIDLQKVKSVDYRYENVYKSIYDAVCIDFLFYDESTITLTDSVPKEYAEDLIKGDHSEVPLLLMYDDIISTYPDKAVRQESAE